MTKELSSLLSGKDIIVLNTKRDETMFVLAHALRSYARKTFCIDPSYKLTDVPAGVREIEGGKVYLMKGDIETDRVSLMFKIKMLGGKPIYIFGGQRNDYL